MKTMKLITALLAAILGLASCNRDSIYEDKVDQVTVYVSAETGMFYNVPNTTLEEGKSVGQVFDSTLNQCLSLSAQRLLCTLEQRSHPLRGGFFSFKKFVFQE